MIDLSNDESNKTHIFRGQRESSWHLKSSLERMIGGMRSGIPKHVEEITRLAFKRGIGAYSPKTFNSNYEYFEMMQHYGAPTRLLDCTMSPYVAAYFAFEHPKTESNGSKHVSIWMIKGGWLTTHNNTVYSSNIDLLKASTSHLYNLADYQNFDFLFKEDIEGIIP
ncbi:MAG: FRG domain-containing protein [Desulfobacteraceae bacterium]|nr:FRG domain-containing protein [Desulfobacteraceae bacterium]